MLTKGLGVMRAMRREGEAGALSNSRKEDSLGRPPMYQQDSTIYSPAKSPRVREYSFPPEVLNFRR